jgi:hypothetical protein
LSEDAFCASSAVEGSKFWTTSVAPANALAALLVAELIASDRACQASTSSPTAWEIAPAESPVCFS